MTGVEERGDPHRPVRKIAVIAPMLNESGHIEQVIDDLTAQDFGGEFEVFVADGGSIDDCVVLLERAAERTGVPVTVLDNPGRIASSGLNVCVKRALATGADLIVRIDIHARFPSDYLRRCAAAAEETGAWNVGGIVMPVGRTPMERAVGFGMRSPFGGVGWTRRRDVRHEADTVSYGAFRPEAFDAVGVWDPAIRITEVEDLNMRIWNAGGKVFYDPEIRPAYVPRGTFKSLFVQYYRYGFYKVPAMLKHRQTLSGRSMIPFAFVLSFVALGVLSVVWVPGRLLLLLELVAYALGALVFAALVIKREGASPALYPRLLAVFLTFHVAHGVGMAHGWLRAAAGLLKHS